jgi:hypothetical protein
LTTRRAVLTAAAGVAAGVGIPLASGSTADAATPTGKLIPQTLARHVSSSGSTIRVSEAKFPLSHLVVGWNGLTRPGVRVRFNSGWSPWQVPHGCGAGKDGANPAQLQRVLLTVPGAIGYEVAHAGSSAGVSIVELNTVSGPTRGTAPAPVNTLHLGGRSAPVRYLSRAAWGADESLRFGADGTETWPPAYFPVQTLTVHHTAGVNDDPDPAATVRAIYYLHTITNGWGDVGYQLLIDQAGSVYEGRWSGTDGIPVFGSALGPDGRPQMVNGAHAIGFNAGNIGVSLLGNFTSQLPTAAARRTLTAVLAILATVTHLNPVGITNYVNPISAATKTVNTISGHRDWNPTECPGNLFYPELPSLRTDVAALLRH